MIFLYLCIVLLIIIILYSFLFNKKNNEKFTKVTRRGINRKLYLNPPKNANKYGIIDSISTIKCENNNCIIEEFSDPSLENDEINDTINKLVIQINTLVANIDILAQEIQQKINNYNINYSTFKTELDKSIITKQNKINKLVDTLGFNIVDPTKPTTVPTTTSTTTTPTTTTPTTTTSSTPKPSESFTNINDRLLNSEKKIDKKLLPYMKGHFILT
jgi:hypothetical protein